MRQLTKLLEAKMIVTVTLKKKEPKIIENVSLVEYAIPTITITADDAEYGYHARLIEKLTVTEDES